jgi:diguanylate cyclase (GGDEF)-like protein
MNNRVDQLVSETSEQKTTLGVIFTDLNGLKQMNDSKGHAAGDTLLKNAAAMLQIVFAGNEIFRAGGDEFLIMVRGTTLPELEALVDQLRKQSNASGAVSFAIGYAFVEDSRNVRKAMKSADENMYEDKSEFYKEYPEKRRR